MNPWLLACLVACFIGVWVPAVHAQGAFEDCCLAYHRHAGRAIVQRAQGYLRQEVSGSCNLPAVIFFFPRRNRKVCGNPQDRWVQNGMKLLDARNKALPKIHKGPLKTRRVSHSEVKKLRPETSKLLVSKLSDPSKSSKRNPSLLTATNLGKDPCPTMIPHISRISHTRGAGSFSTITTLWPQLPQPSESFRPDLSPLQVQAVFQQSPGKMGGWGPLG
ncbi:C-C motif chemokine 25 [Elephas maximus indicus]|uniref:C-C motif chemokine 25 n=1 Tax=Elephas maximus indicus TaxID=99487 RepID=UPI00211651FC|nr:C-C motif chemokine 25 [Elephas maximus indicus]